MTKHQEQPKCVKCERYLSKTKVHKCPKRKPKYAKINGNYSDKIAIDTLEDLNVYIEILPNGCHKWIGPMGTSAMNNWEVTIVYKEGHYTAQNLMVDQLYPSYTYCVHCLYPHCECDGRKIFDLGFKCRFDDCLNKDHFILIDCDEFYKDVDNGFSVDELVTKYGRSKQTFESWIKNRE